MIEIKINNKAIEIPIYRELTVDQYRDLMPFIADAGFIDPLRYICVTTDEDYQKALRYKVNGLGRLNAMCGTFKFIAGDVDMAAGLTYIESSTPKKIFNYERYLYDMREVNLSAAGYRIVLEQFLNTKPNYIDMYSFMLALVINVKKQDDALQFDYDEVIKIFKSLSTYPAFEVLTLGAFFFYRWKRGENEEGWLFRKLKKVISILMRPKKLKLVLIDSRNITQSTK